ncbi:hypothetical protein HYW84_01360 [Candidatus Peregrinibacteria bacterium]|nr:hypothetical protein [Candidatus Peregrinibacteria bacterium]
MDIVVRTGETRAPAAGTSLASVAFSSAGGEQACLLLHGEAHAQNGKTIKDECTTIVKNSLLGTEGEMWNRLDGTLKELNGLLKGFLISGTLDDIHAIIAVADRKGQIHVSAAGRAEAYLIRGGTASQITEYTKGRPVAAFVHISSGILEAGDAVVLSTQRLLRVLTPAQLSQHVHQGDRLLDEVIAALESEKETAAIATVHFPGRGAGQTIPPAESRAKSALQPRRAGTARRSQRGMAGAAGAIVDTLLSLARSAGHAAGAFLGNRWAEKFISYGSLQSLQEKGREFIRDLKDPKRKRRAHLFLLAGAIGAFLVIWLVVSLMTSSQRSKTRAELSELVTQITDELRTADNRRLAGDIDGANRVLEGAEEQAKQVISNASGQFRNEAMSLIDQIRGKKEEINNIIRMPARVLVNLSSKNTSVVAHGLIGLGDGEFLVYDRESGYRVLLNRLDEPKQLTEDDLILQGANFARYKSQVFMTTGNSVVELSANQVIPMKTEDPTGWTTGKDVESYLRYLYVLVPDKNQIFKYERLSNRYSAPVQYNVNGDLAGAVDMAIDASVYVLKEGGVILKLLRGEVQPFVIVHAPGGAPASTANTSGGAYPVLKGATKIFKVPGGNFYFLDPTQGKGRVIVATDSSAAGESSYLRQYVLEGEQIGILQDIYVDPDESRMYVLDEKRVYVVDLATR